MESEAKRILVPGIPKSGNRQCRDAARPKQNLAFDGNGVPILVIRKKGTLRRCVDARLNLEARSHGMEEAVGSIPTMSTIQY